MFNFIKALMPKFSQHITKNDGVFKVQFHNTNLALKTLKWATKMQKFATCCLIFVAKKGGVFRATILLAFSCQKKNTGIKAFMKLTPECDLVVRKSISIKLLQRLLLGN